MIKKLINIRGIFQAALFFGLIALFSSCREDFGRLIPDQGSDQDSVNVAFGTSKVLYIIVDGARGESVRTAGAKTINELAVQSIYSWASLSDETVTGKGTNWTDMLTGVKKGKHGVIDNDFENNNFETFPLIYERIKEIKPESDIRVFTPSTLFKENLTTGADVSEILENDEKVKEAIVEGMKTEDVTLLVGHFTSVDQAGAQNGYDNSVPEYKEAILQFDAYVKEMLDALKARPKYKEENWLVVITSSTGGHFEIPASQNDNTIFSNPDVNTFTIFHTPKYLPRYLAKPYLGNRYQGDFPRFQGERRAELVDGDNLVYNFGTGPFTIEMKVKKNAKVSGYPAILGKRPEWSSGTPGNGWVMFLESNYWAFNARGSGSGQTKGAVLADATWNSIAVVGVIRNNERFIRTYTNGVFNNESNANSWGSFDSDALLKMGYINGKGHGSPDVYVADVRIWNGVGLSDEVIKEYACQIGVEQNHPYYDYLAGYWPVAGSNEGNTIQDEGPLGNHLTLAGGDYSWNRLSEYLCAPTNDDLGAFVPRNADIPAQIITWLKIARQESWQFDGRVWLDR